MNFALLGTTGKRLVVIHTRCIITQKGRGITDYALLLCV